MRDQSPPRWARNAIPTTYGWANPRTGEILVARRDLQNPVEGFVRNRPYPIQNQPPVVLDVKTEEKLVEAVFVEITTQPQFESVSVTDETSFVEVVEQPPEEQESQSTDQPKKRRGRQPKKA